MTLKFATACLSQQETIDRLMVGAFTPYVRKLGGGPTAGPYPWLEAAIRRAEVYVGLDETEIVGVVVTSRRGDELVIEQLGVDPTRQGAGIGRWLLKQIEQTARHDQVKALSLQTAEMMSDLLRLYNQHGFLETRKALPTHGDDTHLRVHMKKLL
jgi:GNAT superfamily N-acetyltransferase